MRLFKRIFDIWFSLIALIVFSPLLVLVACVVRLKLGAPILFSHERPGLHGKPFKLLKFRSMLNTTDEAGNLLPDEQRQTKFGIALRKTSLDELPSLFNVLKGELSFVGPRPLLMCYLPVYSQRERKRHEVRPGITGLAQVNGRNAISWDEKLEYDIQYVENLSLWLDLKILLKTFATVFGQKGISDSSRAIGQEPLDVYRARRGQDNQAHAR
jgi:lipopolysaccharide/colanic/teichoic acid biosynthesis glycosyltransferase